ncbi:MAG: hypothetical protein GYB24_16365 [Rhodobacteraceae bacterium]|nr:hypothetical protein [Paracoccaceae bacterium]
MDFAPNSEQQMIADSFAKVFAAAGEPRSVWEELGALELLRLTWPEDLGGFGAGCSDLVPVLSEAGASGAREPLIGAAALPGLALTRSGTAAPAVPDGEICLVLADTNLQLADGRLTGSVKVVPGADVADTLLLCLPDDRLVALPVGAKGLSLEVYELLDGRGAADLHFQQVELSQGSVGGSTSGLHAWLCDAAAMAFAADALGAMCAIRDMTQEYLKTRKQFGKTLCSFQALQHAMVDIYHDTEHFLSLVHLAAKTCDSDDTAMRMRAVSSVKRYLGGRMRDCIASAIQLHGGIGVTEEYPLGALAKRVIVADLLNGSSASHGARLARLIAEETRAELKVTGQEKDVA